MHPIRVAVTLEQCWHDVPGGTATSALDSVRALQERDDVELVGVSARHGDPPADPWRPPIPVAALPLPRNVLYETWHRLRWPKVQRATGPVDVIHVTGMAMPPASAPLVVTVHDLAFLHEPGHFTRHGVAFFHRAIDLARRDADVVVCPSRATLDDCVAHGFAADRLRLVPWGVDAAPPEPGAVERVRSAHGLDRPFVFWTGTIEPRKNLSALVAAFALVERDDVDLVIGGPPGWNDELASLERSVGGRIKRIGFLPPADLRAVYAAADVFCFPSIREGFGLPVLEAMAQGTPVVTTPGATGEVLGAGEDDEASTAGFVVDPHDVDAIAKALNRILDDPDLAASMGAAGRARAATSTWDRTAGLLVDAYRDAIEVSRRGRP